MGDPGSVARFLLTPTRFSYGTGMAMRVPKGDCLLSGREAINADAEHQRV